MGGIPVVEVTRGGIPVTESDRGLPYEIASNGLGVPVRFVARGGAPVKGVWGLSSLFRAGNSGFIVGPMAAGHTWKDTAASTPVAADGDQVARCDDVAGRGNHATQSSASFRPAWYAGSGRPYILFDGSDDRLLTAFVPTAAVTLAIACRINASGAAQLAIGGGASTGNHRCFLGAAVTSGKINVGWGSENAELTAGPVVTGSDHVILLTGDAVTRDVWCDGALVSSAAPAGGAGPDGTGGGVALGAYNSGGSQVIFMGGRIYGAMAINRRLSPPEITLATAQLKRMYS